MGPAALAVVALAWIDVPSRRSSPRSVPNARVVIAIGVASIVLAAFAAWIQDDLEHVLGYSIIGDAGVVILGARGARDRGVGAGPDLDPRIRRRAQRLRRVGCGDPGDVLDRPDRRPARAGRCTRRSSS